MSKKMSNTSRLRCWVMLSGSVSSSDMLISCWFHADFVKNPPSSHQGSPAVFFSAWTQGCRAHPPGMDAWSWGRWEDSSASWGFTKLGTTQYPLENIPKKYGKSQFLMGKLTISMAIFNSKLLNYQRVTPGTRWVFFWFLDSYDVTDDWY